MAPGWPRQDEESAPPGALASSLGGSGDSGCHGTREEAGVSDEAARIDGGTRPAGQGDLDLYARMSYLRAFEERADTLYRQGVIHGPAHLGLGHEAIAVGAASVLRPGDYSIGTYRGHAHALARGAPPDAVLAELLGRHGGICAGKGGSMHITSAEHGYYGSYAIV